MQKIAPPPDFHDPKGIGSPSASKSGGEVDIFFMRQAIFLAKKGEGRVHPNPLVGAILVKKNKIVGRGCHEQYGGPHAEVNAIRHARVSPAGCTLYVTLEPCAHFGKTPPCTDLIIKNKISRVVIAASDANPLVHNKGIAALKKAGVRVVQGVLEKEVLWLNRDFNHWIRCRLPYVIVKVAQSLDGKIATRTGQSRWITGVKARRFVHKLRASSDAVCVGINTVLADDPWLSARPAAPALPRYKIVLDSRLRTPAHARLFSQPGSKVILVVTHRAPARKRRLFQNKAEILELREKNGRVHIKSLLKALGRRGIVNILIEGGGEVIADAIAQKAVNEMYVFIAPKVIGGKGAPTAAGGIGVQSLEKAPRFKKMHARFIGEDLLVHGFF